MLALPGESMAAARRALARVLDPELPVVSIVDLGMVRDVRIDADGAVTVALTPTYSGCPAQSAIEQDAARALRQAGFASVRITQVLSPPWTTDWMTHAAREALRAHGIAPPTTRPSGLFDEPQVDCPRCDSSHTHRVSEFGSSACKALYACDACLEPFEHFKCL